LDVSVSGEHGTAATSHHTASFGNAVKALPSVSMINVPVKLPSQPFVQLRQPLDPDVALTTPTIAIP
jgi:hypothetical protein